MGLQKVNQWVFSVRYATWLIIREYAHEQFYRNDEVGRRVTYTFQLHMKVIGDLFVWI